MVKDKERGGESGRWGWSEAKISLHLDNLCLEKMASWSYHNLQMNLTLLQTPSGQLASFYLPPTSSIQNHGSPLGLVKTAC